MTTHRGRIVTLDINSKNNIGNPLSFSGEIEGEWYHNGLDVYRSGEDLFFGETIKNGTQVYLEIKKVGDEQYADVYRSVYGKRPEV